MAKKLEVKNLIISFRTNNGTVKAVRDISFDLERGETLAIVGESGSGKSVTARAIMGILAKNAIPEGGEIIYGGGSPRPKCWKVWFLLRLLSPPCRQPPPHWPSHGLFYVCVHSWGLSGCIISSLYKTIILIGLRPTSMALFYVSA